MTDIIYGFVDDKNVLIDTAIVTEGDTETLQRIQNDYQATNAYPVKDLEKQKLVSGKTYWNGVALVYPCIYPSWVWNEEAIAWEAPIPIPMDGNPYVWNEETKSWDRTIVEAI